MVEDEQDIANLIRHTLERSGDFEVQIAGAGDTALKAATDDPPDLVILDLNLPVFDGLDVFRILRARPQTAGVPVIMLTCRTSEDDRVKGLQTEPTITSSSPSASVSSRRECARCCGGRSRRRQGHRPACKYGSDGTSLRMTSRCLRPARHVHAR